MVYDLSHIEYSHKDAVRGLRDVTKAEQNNPQMVHESTIKDVELGINAAYTGPFKIKDVEEMKLEELGKPSSAYRPSFISKRMKVEASKNQPSPSIDVQIAQQKGQVHGDHRTVKSKTHTIPQDMLDEE